jgi:putative Holliday junction resolvase
MRILAIDYGSKRVGIALSDPLLISAQALPYLTNDKTLMANLNQIITTKEVSKIIIGNPINLKGGASQKSTEVAVFKDLLSQQAQQCEIILWDERFSTVAAQKHLIAMDVSRKKRKEKVDSVAAVFILQGYLNSLDSTNA